MDIYKCPILKSDPISFSEFLGVPLIISLKLYKIQGTYGSLGQTLPYPGLFEIISLKIYKSYQKSV